MFGDPVTNSKGWEVKKGVKCCEKITVGVVVKPASNYVKSGVIALRSLNVKPNRIDTSDVVYFSEEDNSNKLAKSKLNKGDVVVVRTGNTGTAAVIPKELDGCNCIDLLIASPKNELNSIYLSNFINSERGKQAISQKEVGGIHKHFNVGALKEMIIPVPPLSIQNEFENFVRLIKKERDVNNKSLKKSSELFSSLVQGAFG
jgi:type I restriction enzyme S subunit